MLFAEEPEEAESYWDYFKAWWWAILIIAVWLIFRGQYGTTAWDTVDLYCLLGLMGGLVIKSVDVSFQNKTHKAICNPMFTTTHGRIGVAGNYGLLTMGDIDAYGIKIEGSEGTWVFPLSALNVRGDNLDIACRLRKTSFEELPLEVKFAIKSNKKYHPPYYFGLADSDVYTRVPDLAFIEEEMRTYNVLIDFLRKQAKMTLEDFENLINYSIRVGSATQGSRVASGIKRVFLKKEEG